MQMEIGPEIVMLIGAAMFIAGWAHAHFNELKTAGEIRFSVPKQQYLAALGVYVAAILAVYAFLVVAAYVGMAYAAVVWTEGPPFDCFQYLGAQPSDYCVKFFTRLRILNGNILMWSALGAALFLRLVVPNVTLTQRFINRLRDQTHNLALFPFARQSLLAALSASKFAPCEGADAQLLDELGRYGIGPELMCFISPSGKRSLLQTLSLRRQLSSLVKYRLADAGPNWDDKSYHNLALSRFSKEREATFAKLETDFRQIIRHTALVLLLVDEITEKVGHAMSSRIVSSFIAKPCDEVLARYRTLVAEAALSCVPHPAERVQFLKFFGYDVPMSTGLPLYPWVIVFVLDFLLFLIASLVLLGGQSPNVRLSQLATFAFVHATSQIVASTWAIYPKTVSNFARPTPYSLPVLSYVVFGLASYLTGAIILLIFRLIVPIPFPVVLPTLVSAMPFLLMSVGLSFLIDLRLQSRSLDFQHGRVREGLIMAVIMAAGTATFQLLIFYVFPAFGWINTGPVPHFFPARALFFLLSAVLGFVLGHYVPAATAAFLQSARVLGLPTLPSRISREARS
jgi:hypothetical protein